MGVRFYQCGACERCKWEEEVGICEKCRQNVCCNCLVNVPEDLRLGEREFFPNSLCNDDGVLSKYCPFCTGKKASTAQLLAWLLQQKQLTREQAEAEYQQQKR